MPDGMLSRLPYRRNGQVCIRDTKITVGDILYYLSTGLTQHEIVIELNGITYSDIRAALMFAMDVIYAHDTVMAAVEATNTSNSPIANPAIPDAYSPPAN